MESKCRAQSTQLDKVLPFPRQNTDYFKIFIPFTRNKQALDRGLPGSLEVQKSSLSLNGKAALFAFIVKGYPLNQRELLLKNQFNIWVIIIPGQF